MKETDIIKIECDEVICDICSEDYTNAWDIGGAIVMGCALCPKCFFTHTCKYGVPKRDVIRNNPFTPFAAFVKAIRAKQAS